MIIRSRQFVRVQRIMAQFGEMGVNREAPQNQLCKCPREALRYFEALRGQDRSARVRSLMFIDSLSWGLSDP